MGQTSIENVIVISSVKRNSHKIQHVLPQYKKGKTCKTWKLEEAFAIWKGKLNVKNSTANKEVTEEGAKVIHKYCILFTKCSSNLQLFHNWQVFTILNNITGLKKLGHFNLPPPLIQCNELRWTISGVIPWVDCNFNASEVITYTKTEGTTEKDNGHPVTCQTDTAGRYVQVQIYPCSTLTLELDGWSLSHPDHFPPENRLSTQCTGDRLGLGAGQDGSEKLCCHRGSNPNPKEMKYNLQPYNRQHPYFRICLNLRNEICCNFGAWK
jgi:hypothetical protein